VPYISFHIWKNFGILKEEIFLSNDEKQPHYEKLFDWKKKLW